MSGPRQQDIPAGQSAIIDGPVFGALVLDYADGASWQFDEGRIDSIVAYHKRLASPLYPYRRVKVTAPSSGPVTVLLAYSERDELGDVVAKKSQRYSTSDLSSAAGDALSTSAPTDGSTQGYALAPSMTAIRVALLDSTTARTVTKWVQGPDGKWRSAGQLITTPKSTGAGEVVFDQGVLVGAGRLYLQIDDAVGALSAIVTAQVTP